MHVELINTGTELLLGRILNSHQQWLCRQLADAGYVVSRQVAVPDTGADIQQAVREALSRSDLIITTGGLGPTSDDLTRSYIAELLGRTLVEAPAIVENIRAFFASRNRPMPDSTRVQALVPEGALVLPNPHGTAPGLAIEAEAGAFRSGGSKSWIIMLPGPPRELRPMFLETVAPLLRQVLPPPATYICKTLRTTGIGESVLEERLVSGLEALVADGLEVGYCARTGQVDVRLAGRGPSAEVLVGKACDYVRGKLGEYIYGEGDEDLEIAVVRRLIQRKETISLAESCTGGLLAHRFTNVPGASEVFLAGYVTYSNEAKKRLLGVREPTLVAHGAVSEAVAREMAEGARRDAATTYALAITGIAGPSGGSPEKPAGTVYIGLASPSGTTTLKRFNPLDRETFKNVTTQQALELLWQAFRASEPKVRGARAEKK